MSIYKNRSVNAEDVEGFIRQIKAMINLKREISNEEFGSMVLDAWMDLSWTKNDRDLEIQYIKKYYPKLAGMFEKRFSKKLFEDEKAR